MANSGASSVDWRAEFTPERRMQVTQMIEYCLKRNQMGRRLSLDDLRKTAANYEAKIYTDATDRDEYLRKIQPKMEKVDTITADPSHPNPSLANKSSLHSGSVGMRPIISQQQQQPFDQLHFQKQLQQQPMKLKIQHPSQLPAHLQQQLQQEPFFNPNQLQSSRQPLMPMKSFFESSSCTNTTTHPRMMQSGPQHNQQNVIQQSWPQLMQHLPQSIARQPTVYYQTNPCQQHPNSVPQKVPQNFVFPLHQQQPLRNQQSNMHQKQMFPLPKNVPYMMHPSSSGHQNSLAYQTQKMQTDPLFNKQQLGLQSNISQLQQQRLVGPQSSVSSVQSRKRSMHMSQAKIEGEQKNQQPSLQSHKRSMHMSQAKIEGEQQNRQPSFTLFQSQDHQSQHQPPLQNLMPQTQSPQWLAMQKQNNPLQITEMQERSQASGSGVVAQSYNTMDQQNRSSQSQTGPPSVSSSSSTDSTAGHAVDWQEGTYRKIQNLKKLYLGKLSEEHRRIALKVQQQTLLPPAEQLEDFGKLEVLMDQLLQAIVFLELNKTNIRVGTEKKVAEYESQIRAFLEAVTSRRIAASKFSAQQQFQHAGGHAQSILQQQPLQVTNLQQRGNHVNDCLQSQKCLLHDGSARTNKMKRHISAVSVNDKTDFESTATSKVQRQKGEADPALLKEILDINRELFSTVVSLIKKDDTVSDLTSSGGGTMVKLSFSDVFLCPRFRSHYASGQMSSITPLRLLVLANYPESSPIILDKLQVDASEESVEISVKVRSIFYLSIHALVQPMSLREMTRTWDTSVRKVITEYAEKRGGGSFSSRYGAWESCATS